MLNDAIAVVRLFLSLLMLLTLAVSSVIPGTAGAIDKGDVGDVGLDVRRAGDETVASEPRKILSLSFRVSNRGAGGLLAERLTLPAGWRTLARGSTFELIEGTSLVRHVSVYVPEGALAGDYRVGYSVARADLVKATASTSVSVRVLALMRLNVSVVEAPDFVTASEPYKVSFLLQNRGNAPLALQFETKSARNFSVVGGAGPLSLEPGASGRVEVTVRTLEVQRQERDWLTLTARVPGTKIAERATQSVPVLPRVSGAEQKYRTIPVTAGVTWVDRDESGRKRRTSGTQALVAGGGVLDAEGERRVDFLLRGPRTDTRSGYGLPDQFSFSYADKRLSVALGDQIYALSPLTEAGYWGRGASALYRGDIVDVEGFSAQDPGTVRKQRSEAGARVGVQLGVSRWDLAVLHKDYGWQSDIAALRNQTIWRPGLLSDIEWATGTTGGQSGNAGRLFVQQSQAPLTYSFTAVNATPGYHGYYADQRFAVLDLRYAPTTKWDLHAFVRMQRQNLNAVPTRPAPDQRDLSLGAGWRSADGATISADVLVRSNVDRRLRADFDIENRAIRVSAFQGWPRLTVFGSAQFGRSDDHLRQRSFGTRLLVGNAYWRVTDAQTLGVFAVQDSNAYSDHWQATTTTLGFNGNARLSERDLVLVSASRNVGVVTTNYVDLRYEHKFANRQTLNVGLRHRTGDLAASTEAMVSYMVALDLPVGRRKGLGSLGGRVYDEATGKGIADVVLNLDGLMAISDVSGRFMFPAVKIGNRRLSIHRSDAASGSVPVKPMPMEVVIRDMADDLVDVPMVRGVVIGGIVRIFGPADQRRLLQPVRPGKLENGSAESSAASAPLIAAGVAANILVTMRNGEQIYRRVTDNEGRFRLGGLVAGRWTVSLDDGDLPADQVPETRQLVFDIEPGGQVDAEFKLMPKVRAIRMQLQPTAIPTRPAAHP